MSVWGWVSSGEWFRKEFSQTKREAQTIEKLKKNKKKESLALTVKGGTFC